MHVTQCECKQPGWCGRHRCDKTVYWFEMCRRREDYFQAWERGERVGQISPVTNAGLVPCQHRGDQPLGSVECDLCGGTTLVLPIYPCAVFGQCTERRFGTRTEEARRMPTCLRCDQYVARESGERSVLS